jgi:hypothetical protein
MPDTTLMTRPDFPFSQIASRDLDIPIVGQLLAANLPLCDEFEPGPMKVVGFEASFRSRGLGQQDLENAPGNPHYTLILAHPDAELDGVSVGVPTGIRRKAEKHGSLRCSANVLRNIP